MQGICARVVLAPQTAMALVKHCRSVEAQAPSDSLATGIRVCASEGLVIEAKCHADTFLPCTPGCFVPKLGKVDFPSQVISPDSLALLEWVCCTHCSFGIWGSSLARPFFTCRKWCNPAL